MCVFMNAYVEKKWIFPAVNGFICNIKGEERLIKIYNLLSVVDTIARWDMNGTVPFNSHDGCDWCLHRKEWYEGLMRYSKTLPIPILRDINKMIEWL